MNESLLSSGLQSETMNYWIEKFRKEYQELRLPKDYSAQGNEKGEYLFNLPAELSAQILRLGKNQNLAVFTVILCALHVFLNKWCDQDDMTVVIPALAEESLNPYLFLRTEIDPEQTFKSLLFQEKQSLMDAYKHHYFSIRRLSELLGEEAAQSVFRVALHMQGLHREEFITSLSSNPNNELVFSFAQTDGLIKGKVLYRLGSFDEATICRITEWFIQLFMQVMSSMERPIQEYEYITSEEKNTIIYEFNNTKAYYPKDKLLYELFEEQAAKTPDQVAIICKNERMTYKEMNRRSNQLARKLRSLGVGCNESVAMYCQRSPEMLVGIMAILKAGGCYLPIDPKCPIERRDYMLDFSRVRVVLTDHSCPGLEKQGLEIIALDEAANYSGEATNMAPVNSPADLAYVIYTSGSTGVPKGVMVEHHSVVNRLHWMQKKFPLQRNDVILQKTPYTFDVSVWEIFWWSFQGAKVCILEPEGEKNPIAILEAIHQGGVTVMHFVPSMLDIFVDYVQQTGNAHLMDTVKVVFASGEALHGKHVQNFHSVFRNKQLVNLYGPTEGTVDVSYHVCSESHQADAVPIGKPIDNIGLFVVNRSNQLQPVGVPGELVITGVGVARGYLNQQDLTDARFKDNCITHEGQMYRTGDWAKWTAGGELEYIGRIDYQVKIRGNRIEIPEIELQLLKVEMVKSAVVLVQEDRSSNKELTAYYAAGKAAPAGELAAFLSAYLPGYMIPARFIHLDEMPLNANGKIDRHALKMLTEQVDHGQEQPANEMERRIHKAWAGILGLSEFGIDDNFFNLGGDSLKAIQIVAALQKSHIELDISYIYEHPTIRRLAVHAKQNESPANDLSGAIERVEKLRDTILNDPLQAAFLPEQYEDFYPISDIQLGMIFYSLKNSGDAVYHEQFVYEIEDDCFVLEALNKSMGLMLKKHPILRTTFDIQHFHEPVQIVHNNMDYIIDYIDITGYSKDDQQRIIALYQEEDKRKPFIYPLQEGFSLLWRMKAFQINTQSVCICWSFHHALLDGWSNATFSTEIINTYFQMKSDGFAVFEKLSSTYYDYVLYQLSLKEKNDIYHFWEEELNEYKRSQFPKRSKEAGEGAESKASIFKIDEITTQSLKQFAAQNQVSLKTVLFSAYLYMLNLYSHDNDIVAGIVDQNRLMSEDSHKILGCFLNTIPVRFQLGDSRLTWRDLIHRVEEKLTKLKYFGRMPLYEISKHLGEMGNSNPFFDTLFNYVDFYVYNEVKQDLSAKSELSISNYERTNTLFDFTISNFDSELEIRMIYKEAYLPVAEVEIYADYYLAILEQFIKNPDIQTNKEQILNDRELERMNALNETQKEYPSNTTIHQLFEEQAELFPENIALLLEDATITYGELNRKVNRLAHCLTREFGIQPGDRIAICMHRGFDMIVTLLAVMKSGAAYVPIEPDYPQERKEAIMKDAEVRLMVSGDAEEGIYHPRLLRYNDKHFRSFPSHNNDVRVSGVDVAYIIYTSGSTGTPKGVTIAHHSVVNLICWVNQRFDIGRDDRLLFVTSISFDLSVYDLFGILSAGGQVVIADKESVMDPRKLHNLLYEQRITFWDSVPSTLSHLVGYMEDSELTTKQTYLRLVFMSGDWIGVGLPARIQGFFPNAQCISLGGATEASIWSIYYPIEESCAYEVSIPYGKPIDNNQFYILDNSLQRMPYGAVGELFIGGAGLSLGYHKNEGMTKEAFLSDPYTGKQLYKTGDMGRFLADGNIEFMGRLEQNQVKIRGFRVELGEIEYQLRQHEAIKEAIVSDFLDEDRHRSLVAYYLPVIKGISLNLREYLMEKLADYMIPSYFIEVDQFPLNGNGKVDKKQLPAVKKNHHQPDTTPYAAPVTEHEKILTEIWQAVLGYERIGVEENFFQLGGDSIKSIQILSQLHKHQMYFDMKDLFEFQTISKLSECLKDTNSSIDQSLIVGEIPLMPIHHWFFEVANGQVNHFNQAMMIHREGGFDEALVHSTFDSILMHHDVLRSIFARKGTRTVQINRGWDSGLFSLESFDLCGLDEEHSKRILRESADAIHSSLNLLEGPLVRLALYECGTDSRLLVVIHHLLADSISLNIIYEDFVSGYEALLQGKSITFPDKTHSYKDWAIQTIEYASSNLDNELPYWRNLKKLAAGIELKNELGGTAGTVGESEVIEVAIPSLDIDALLTKANLAFHTEISDLLITSLMLAFHKWSGMERLLLQMELSGRSNVHNGGSTERTVGCFDTRVPVLIEMKQAGDLSYNIRNIKETIRRIPNQGAGFGMLAYLTPNREQIEITPAISFSYSGQSEKGTAEKIPGFLVSSQCGQTISPLFPQTVALEFKAWINNDELVTSVRFSNNQYRYESMQSLMNLYFEQLKGILDYCMLRDTQMKTPSDLGYRKNLRIEDLDKLTQRIKNLK